MKKQTKNSQIPGGLAHSREIFRVDAAFMAVHFPAVVVWGRNPTNEVLAPKQPNHAHFWESK